ncbi:MAG: AgmX/PglI C-terminal domain-containing protein [Alphaproteobacteria bacterium]|nr:AgmX/PglI C-terminal domain-containing protein [Alphaproteobacteria bacterium]
MVGVLVALAGAELALASGMEDDGLVRFVVSEGEGSLVLEHTSVRAVVEGGLAVVDVEQRFHNPFEHAIDATYLFPLPPEAAVQGMTLRCGSRRMEAEVLKKEEAAEKFRQAAAEGRKAALLEQHRPNLFQQSVASLCPGEDVTVTLRYLDPLVVEDGHVELSFPTTVGPRYRPDGVPQPPFTTVPSRDIDVSVTIAEGMPVESLWSDTHEIEVVSEDAETTVVRNAVGDDLPNKDFHLAWSLAGVDPRMSVLALPPVGDEPGYVAVTLQPKVLEDLDDQRPRELLFVLDESCSMQGAPFEAEVATVRLALSKMRPDDRFDLVRFSSAASALFDEPKPATPGNIALAQKWLEVFDGGGTEMTAGIRKSLTLPGDPERLRLVLMLTDGYIGNEQEVLQAVGADLGEARLFSLGVGSSVNHALLDALADVGRGDVTYQLPETPPAEIVDTFYDRIAHPALTDLELDWGELNVVDVYPSRIPDLFAGQPVRVVARYTGKPVDTTVTLTGFGASELYTVHRPLDLSAAEEHPGLPALWARRAIADLERRRTIEGLDDDETITSIALRHHLVSRTTSLVATEKVPSSCGPSGDAPVEVPSMLPAGMEVGGLIGATGQGIGGGGTAMGIGGLGTRGMGSGAAGYGSGGGSFGVQGEGGIGAPVGKDAIILGALDKSLIDQVIRRHMNQIRYCYQRELTKEPTLAGKVVVKFVIAASGDVAAAEIKSSTLGNAAVEECIRGRVLRMTFPQPGGGGVVVVSYPFVFSPN